MNDPIQIPTAPLPFPDWDVMLSALVLSHIGDAADGRRFLTNAFPSCPYAVVALIAEEAAEIIDRNPSN